MRNTVLPEQTTALRFADTEGEQVPHVARGHCFQQAAVASRIVPVSMAPCEEVPQRGGQDLRVLTAGFNS